MSLLDQQEITDQDQISGVTLNYLLKAAKWMQFVAICGFMFLVMFGVSLFAIPDLMMGDVRALGNSFARGMMVVMVIFLVIGLFPNIFLYQSAVNFIRYARDNNSFNLEVAFKKLHSLFLFMGILVIMNLAIFVLAMMGMGL